MIGAYIVAVAIRQALKSTSMFAWENKNKANA